MTLVTLSSVIKRPLTEHVFRLVRSGTLLSRLARVRNFSNSVIAYCFTLFEADSDNFLVYICTRRSAHDHFLTLIKRSRSAEQFFSVRSETSLGQGSRSPSSCSLANMFRFFRVATIFISILTYHPFSLCAVQPLNDLSFSSETQAASALPAATTSRNPSSFILDFVQAIVRL